MVALDNGQPKLLNLKQLLEAFLKHRREIVTKRCIFELKQARERAHILEGLGIALANIDEMIALIKASKTPAIAKEGLLARTWNTGMVKAMLEQAGADDFATFRFGLKNMAWETRWLSFVRSASSSNFRFAFTAVNCFRTR